MVKNEKKGFLFQALALKNVRKILSCHKPLVMLLVMSLLCCSGLFAEDDFGVATMMNTIIEFLTNKWVIGVFFVAFCVECILLMTTGRADGQAWKKFVPILAGTILFLAGPTVTKKFMNMDKLSNASKTMGLIE